MDTIAAMWPFSTLFRKVPHIDATMCSYQRGSKTVKSSRRVVRKEA